MLCKYCNVPMKEGKALSYTKLNILGWRVGTLVLSNYFSAGTLSPCFKCPECGHSVNQPIPTPVVSQ